MTQQFLIMAATTGAGMFLGWKGGWRAGRADFRKHVESAFASLFTEDELVVMTKKLVLARAKILKEQP